MIKNMNKKLKSFRRGDIVEGSQNVILVTGNSRYKEYPSFSGVIIMSKKYSEEERPWPIGMYSETWSFGAFKKVKLPLSKLVYEKLYLPNP